MSEEIPNLTSDSTSEIRECLLTYGEDVLKTKFPHYIDGLKDVTRRILWFTRDQRETASFLKVMGNIVENHVAGDSSVYGAIIRLGQPFMVGHPLIHIEGKSGSYHSPNDAAAPRYLNMAISEFSRDIFFNGIHPRTIPMVPTKNFSAMEPKYLIPKLPMALILGNLTIGFGFKSTVPMIDFEDVCDLVMCFSEFHQSGKVGRPEANKIAKYLIPTFPILNIIKNRKALLNEYSHGEYGLGVSLEGWADLTGNSVTLRALPYEVDFGQITDKIRELMKNDRKHWLWKYIVTANQYSSSEAEFTMEIKRGMNPYEVFEKLKPLLKFERTWNPIYSYMKDGRAIALNPALLAELWYEERCLSIAGGLKYQQSDIVTKKMTAEAILQVCERTDDVIKIIRNSDTEEEAVKILYKEFEQLTWRQARIIAQQRLSILAKANKQAIEQDIERLNEEMTSIVGKFTKINESIYQDAQFLKKKYKTTRKSRISEEYKGCVQFGTLGATNFFNDEDLEELLNSRGWSVPKTVVFYPNKAQRIYAQNGKLVYPDEYTRDVLCTKVLLGSQRDNQHLLILEPGKAPYIYTTKCPITDFEYCWVDEEFMVIRKNGTIAPMNINEINPKLKVSPQMPIYGYSKDIQDPIVIHMNTEDTNNLRIDFPADKFSTVPTGTTHILAVVPRNTEELFLNLPGDCTKNTVISFLTLKNLDKLPPKQTIINVNKSKPGFHFTKNKNIRTWAILDFAR